jgi:hypothetical protein
MTKQRNSENRATLYGGRENSKINGAIEKMKMMIMKLIFGCLVRSVAAGRNAPMLSPIVIHKNSVNAAITRSKNAGFAEYQRGSRSKSTGLQWFKEKGTVAGMGTKQL